MMISLELFNMRRHLIDKQRAAGAVEEKDRIGCFLGILEEQDTHPSWHKAVALQAALLAKGSALTLDEEREICRPYWRNQPQHTV